MNSIVLFVNKRHVSTVILTNITFVSALPFVHEHPCYAIRFYNAVGRGVSKPCVVTVHYP